MSQIAIREPSIEAMRQAPVSFRYGSNKRRILIDAYSASAVLAVYEAASPANREKLERMVLSLDGLLRVQSFAFRLASKR